MASNSNNSSGSFFTSGLAVLFIGLKLTGYINWPWVWVLAPIWVPIAVVVVILVIAGLIALVESKRS